MLESLNSSYLGSVSDGKYFEIKILDLTYNLVFLLL